MYSISFTSLCGLTGLEESKLAIESVSMAGIVMFTSSTFGFFESLFYYKGNDISRAKLYIIKCVLLQPKEILLSA